MSVRTLSHTVFNVCVCVCACDECFDVRRAHIKSDSNFTRTLAIRGGLLGAGAGAVGGGGGGASGWLP